MAVDERYRNARATREDNSGSYDFGSGISKRNKKKVFNKIKKSSILIVVAITLILGIVGGFFITKYTSEFGMLAYKVNGVQSDEIDYVVVDVSQIRNDLNAADGNEDVSMETLYESIELSDTGVVCKFLGMDISKTITKTYYYREDISFAPIEVKNIDVSVPGVYYIEYSSSHFAFKNTTLIRTIVVTGVEIDG